MSGASVLIIGCGDAGLKIAAGPLQRSAVSRLTLADSAAERIQMQVDMLACCHAARITLQALDGARHREVEACIQASKPDLIVQAASLIGPWAIIGRVRPLAVALSNAGGAVQLPAQLPVLTTVMTALKDLGLDVPVANLSMPDITHPILARRALAPTIGLGNVSILHLRARAALLARRDSGDKLPLLRLVGHHHHVYGVMRSRVPERPADLPQVYVGEEAHVDAALAYVGVPFPPGGIYNVITAAAALPVICALLPGAEPLRFSAPAPMGLPGGTRSVSKTGGCNWTCRSALI